MQQDASRSAGTLKIPVIWEDCQVFSQPYLKSHLERVHSDVLRKTEQHGLTLSVLAISGSPVRHRLTDAQPLGQTKNKELARIIVGAAHALYVGYFHCVGAHRISGCSHQHER